MRRFITLTLMLTLTLATTAAAVTRSVPSAAYPTIQSAIDAAAPGDVIVLAPGTYNENEITIPASKPDLTIAGVCYNPDAVVIDATLLGEDDDGIVVEADRTTIRCLSIQHAYTAIDGEYGVDDLTVYKVHVYRAGDYGIDADGDRFSLTASKFKGIEETAVDVEGDDAVISGNEVRLTSDGCYRIDGDRLQFTNNKGFQCEDDQGLDLEGNDARIERNTFEQVDSEGIEVDGDRNSIRGNTLSNSGDSADSIYVDGDDNVIESNEVRFAYPSSAAVYVDGDRNRVRSNVVDSVVYADCYEICGDDNIVELNTGRRCGEAGIYVDGDAMIVRQNTIEGSIEYAYDIDCEGRCDEALVVGNVGTGTNEDAEVFYVDAEPGLTVEGNVAAGMDIGFALDMDGGTISRNTCRLSGADSGNPGIEVDGNDNEVTYNQTHDGAASGLEIDGSRNSVRYNVARNNLIDGITICPDQEPFLCQNAAGLLVGPSCAEGLDQPCVDALGAGSSCSGSTAVCVTEVGYETEDRCSADQACVDRFGAGAACVEAPFEYMCASASGDAQDFVVCAGPAETTGCVNYFGAGATCVPNTLRCANSRGTVIVNRECSTAAYCSSVYGTGATCVDLDATGLCVNDGQVYEYNACTQDAACEFSLGSGASCAPGRPEDFDVCRDAGGRTHTWALCVSDAYCVDDFGDGASCVEPPPPESDECADNEVRNNTTQFNRGEGIDNQGLRTTLTGNFSTGNRDDCANTGTIATASGNVCADGSDFTVPGPIDPN